MDVGRFLRHYNLTNISGEEIDLVLTDANGDEHTFVFEKDEMIEGIFPDTIERMQRSDPNILRFVRLEPVYNRPLVCKKKLVESVNWKEEGF